MAVTKITLFAALVVVAIAVITLPSVEAGKKGGHKIIVTSGSKKKCGCHKQTIPVPVPVPVPVHVPHHGHGHGHGYGGSGGFAERMAYGWRKRRSLVDAIKSAAGISPSTQQVDSADKK